MDSFLSPVPSAQHRIAKTQAGHEKVPFQRVNGTVEDCGLKSRLCRTLPSAGATGYLSIPEPVQTIKKYMSEDYNISRERMVELLNGDLSREYQAIIAYTIYSQTIKGAAFNNIASELESHAAEELSHAILLARQIDYLNGTPTNTPEEVKMSDKAEEMLQFDLENERQTIVNYRTRIRQADAMGEFALGEVLRKIIEQEQDHLLDLADALGIDAPKVGD
jgi:bacterioferritin